MSFPRQAPPSSTTILRTCSWRRAPESGSGVFSAISGLREPTDDPVGPVLRDDRDPADAPVRKAAPVGRQRMVASLAEWEGLRSRLFASAAFREAMATTLAASRALTVSGRTEYWTVEGQG
jgi:hypothetical protein